ncbi:MAG TPA: phosphate--AMP phosphotransferase, partial [Acidobacteriota bacterium]|nr:phosphate--AMP phosphotransferase [Acidobacteriota bacterium]
FAPWNAIAARDQDFAAHSIFQHVIDSLSGALKTKPEKKIELLKSKEARNHLQKVDLSKKLSQDEYEKELNEYQHELRRLQFKIGEKKRSVVFVYEGWDAAGKGGNIRRLTAKLDPRWVEVHAFAAPSHEEKNHHYLWRFWKKVPPAGMFAIFDRSWYGRVLVERVENFATVSEWSRAYQEIREFEEHLTNAGTIVLKFWLHISKEEQLRRFKERQRLIYKNYKITNEDWRNRKKWQKYFDAVADMIEKTNTAYAPWIVVEGNSKWWARVRTVRAAVEHIESQL